jgi:hypothetical protein
VKASSFARKIKHLTRGRYVLVNSDEGFIVKSAFRSCPRCGWRGLWARTFARPGKWTYNVIAMTLRRDFAVCRSCSYWEELR